MTHPIPVCIGVQKFASMNQARMCYTKILHRYDTDSYLSETDSTQVLALLSAQQSAHASAASPVKVVRAQYGRNCFEVHSSAHQRQKISIMKSIRHQARSGKPPTTQ